MTGLHITQNLRQAFMNKLVLWQHHRTASNALRLTVVGRKERFVEVACSSRRQIETSAVIDVITPTDYLPRGKESPLNRHLADDSCCTLRSGSMLCLRRRQAHLIWAHRSSFSSTRTWRTFHDHRFADLDKPIRLGSAAPAHHQGLPMRTGTLWQNEIGVAFTDARPDAGLR